MWGFSGPTKRIAKIAPTVLAMVLDPDGVTPADLHKLGDFLLDVLEEMDPESMADTLADMVADVPADRIEKLRAVCVDVLAALDRPRFLSP